MKESFTYIFKDNKWKIKSFIYFLFAIVIVCSKMITINPNNKDQILVAPAFALIMFILCLIVWTITAGYQIANVRAFQEQNSNYVIPYVNLKNNFILGLRYWAAYWLFNLPCLLIITILGFIAGLFMMSKMHMLSSIVAVICGIFVLFYVLYILLFSMGYYYMFAKEPKFNTFYRIKTLFGYISKCPKRYFLSVLCNVGLGIVLAFLAVLITSDLIKNPAGLVIIPIAMSAFLTYSFFVANMLTAKSIIENEPVETL